MIELLEYIDCQVKDCISGIKQFGLCHLLEGDNEKYPATVEKRATKAVPDDRFDVCTYHRILSGTPNFREDVSFGKNITRQTVLRVRMVIFVKLVNDVVIDSIINSLPNSFDINGFSYSNVGENVNLITDRAAIWNDEFSNAYKDKYQMVWHIYALEYDLQYIKCDCCV